MPHSVEAAVASSVGSAISAGFAAPACARRAIIVVGKSCTLDVFTTRNRIIASLARPSG